MIKSIKEKYNNISIPVKASLWFVVCSVLQKGIALITVPLFTRLMTAEEYGFFSTYTSWYSLILVFTSLNLYYGVFNNAMIKYKNDRECYISSMQGLTITITFICFAFYLINMNKINKVLGMQTILVVLLFIQLLFAPSFEFWLASNRFEYSYKKIVTITLCKSIFNPILGIILVLNSQEKAIARILSLVIIEVVFSGLIMLFQFLKGKTFFEKKYWKYAFFFNLPLLPHYLSGQILNQSDRIMISKYVNNAAVAKYSVAYSIGLLTNIITNAINGSFTPWFYQKLKEKEYESISKIIMLITLIMAIVSIILMLFGPEMIFIMAPKEYINAKYVIPPVASSVLFIFLYNIFANVEFYFEKRKFVLYGSIISAFLNVVLNYIFIPKYGYIAAAYTTLICYILYCIMHACFSKIICKQNYIPITIFPWKVLIYISLFVILMSVFIGFIYSYTIIRYIIILVFISFSLILSKKFILFFKENGLIK